MNYSRPDVSLTPVMSGYQDKETQDLELTTNYAPMMERSASAYEDFRIVIPKDQIVSVRLFDPDTYQQFLASITLVNPSSSYRVVEE